MKISALIKKQNPYTTAKGGDAFTHTPPHPFIQKLKYSLSQTKNYLPVPPE